MDKIIDGNEIMQALLCDAQDIIYFKDASGKYVAVSNSFAVHSKSAAGDVIGKTDFDLLPAEQAEKLFLEDKNIIETGKAVVDKVEKRTCPGGPDMWLSVTKTPWKNSAGETIGIIGVCREITERAEREKHILDMLSIATHDMRGPLISIGSMVKLLTRGTFGTIDESVKVTLVDISGRIGCLEKLMGEYLCKSSLMNVRTPDKEVLDLRQDIIDPILEEFLSEIEESKIRIDNRLGAIPGNKIMIKANAKWIRIVYRNLIRNAIKYAAEGQIAFGFEDKGDHYQLNVYNSGPPVPAERGASIFEKFESSDSTGLGLAICRNLIQKHGGNMWYENTWDNHPNFIFTIPK
ncbi:MAG: PAS domain-containing sensor histidine kinase [Nitrospirae bacterium]|nr:PAS domain-containing sensor histidine kinase [Nitrospirota bacterium]